MSANLITRPDPAATEGTPPGPSDAPSPGSIAISEMVVAKLAARAVLEIADAGGSASRLLGHVLPGAGRLGIRSASLTSLPNAEAQVDGSLAFIKVEISVRWPASISHVTTAVRHHIRERLTALTGLTVADVRIAVTDLVTATPSVPTDIVEAAEAPA